MNFAIPSLAYFDVCWRVSDDRMGWYFMPNDDEDVSVWYTDVIEEINELNIFPHYKFIIESIGNGYFISIPNPLSSPIRIKPLRIRKRIMRTYLK
ncbi:hypothetical protein GEMRC1_000349 [Eukaryota sp. GEM-RC1]